MANQLLQPSADSNSEVDACTFLIQKEEMLKKPMKVSFNKTVGQHIDGCMNIENFNIGEKNSETYVLGWECSIAA